MMKIYADCTTCQGTGAFDVKGPGPHDGSQKVQCIECLSRRIDELTRENLGLVGFLTGVYLSVSGLKQTLAGQLGMLGDD